MVKHAELTKHLTDMLIEEAVLCFVLCGYVFGYWLCMALEAGEGSVTGITLHKKDCSGTIHG